MDLCIYNEILDMILITDKKLLHFKLSKSGQMLRVDKTCFPRLGHNCQHYVYLESIKMSKIGRKLGKCQKA